VRPSCWIVRVQYSQLAVCLHTYLPYLLAASLSRGPELQLNRRRKKLDSWASHLLSVQAPGPRTPHDTRRYKGNALRSRHFHSARIQQAAPRAGALLDLSNDEVGRSAHPRGLL
jgi:hypothetical protein